VFQLQSYNFCIDLSNDRLQAYIKIKMRCDCINVQNICFPKELGPFPEESSLFPREIGFFSKNNHVLGEEFKLPWGAT
jgi:hypothetical protein